MISAAHNRQPCHPADFLRQEVAILVIFLTNAEAVALEITEVGGEFLMQLARQQQDISKAGNGFPVKATRNAQEVAAMHPKGPSPSVDLGAAVFPVTEQKDPQRFGHAVTLGLCQGANCGFQGDVTAAVEGAFLYAAVLLLGETDGIS